MQVGSKINNNSRYFSCRAQATGHSLENDEPSDESRLPVLTTNDDFDISWLPQVRVSNLLSSHFPASNGQGKEILVIHLLMANLHSGPFSDLWQLGTIDIVLSLMMVVFVEEDMCQDNPRKREPDGNSFLLIFHNYSKAQGRC